MMLRSLILILAILPAFAAENIKAVGAVSKANIKAVGTVAEANIKAFGVVDNTGGGGASAIDTFNRADEALGASPMSDGVSTWQNGPGPNLGDLSVAGFLCVGSGGGDKAARVATPTFAANQWAQITIVAANIVDVAPVVRMDANGNCYFGYVFDNNNVEIVKMDSNGSNGVSLDQFVTTSVIVAGDILRLEVSGTSPAHLELFLNGVSQGTFDDSSTPHTSGQPGVFIVGDEDLDTFSAGDL